MSRPRIRTLKPDFFKHRKILKLSVGVRYVAVGLVSMVDDRGRVQRLLPAMRAFVFPAGEITERQFDKALCEIESVGFAWRYEVDGFSYLWLPGFWEHQWLNRPTESHLPPHPDDPYGGLPIREAIEQYKTDHADDTENSQSTHRAVVPRAGARVGARSLPFPEELIPHVEKTLEVLNSLAERKGAKAVSRESLESTIAARPRKPLVRAAYDCAAYWDGTNRPLRNVLSAYRNWLDREDDLATVERLPGEQPALTVVPDKALASMNRWQDAPEYQRDAS